MTTKPASFLAVLLAAVVLAVIGLHWNYQIESRDAYRHARDSCVLRTVSKALLREYRSVGRFPDPGNIDEFVFSLGYPDNLGCGIFSRDDSAGKGFVDTSGAPYSYDFVDPHQVALSGNQPPSQNPRRYELTSTGMEIVELGTGERLFLEIDAVLW